MDFPRSPQPSEARRGPAPSGGGRQQMQEQQVPYAERPLQGSQNYRQPPNNAGSDAFRSSIAAAFHDERTPRSDDRRSGQYQQSYHNEQMDRSESPPPMPGRHDLMEDGDSRWHAGQDPRDPRDGGRDARGGGRDMEDPYMPMQPDRNERNSRGGGGMQRDMMEEVPRTNSRGVRGSGIPDARDDEIQLPSSHRGHDPYEQRAQGRAPQNAWGQPDSPQRMRGSVNGGHHPGYERGDPRDAYEDPPGYGDPRGHSLHPSMGQSGMGQSGGGRVDNILCAVLALIKELDGQGIELVRRAVEQRQSEL